MAGDDRAAPEGGTPEPERSGVAASLRRHPWTTAGTVVLIVALAGLWTARDVVRLALTPEEPIDQSLPMVEPLVPGPDEVVYRIDAARSLATVEVTERLAGQPNEVELTTRGISGDIGVTAGDATTARTGEVAVNVLQLRSDNNLRDKAIRHDFLESHHHQTVSLHDTRVVDVRQDSPTTAELAIEGTLEVRTVSRPVRFEATASLEGDELTATATTTITMSEFEVGPITKVGLVSTDDEVRITLDLVAVDGRDFTPPIGLVDEQVTTAASSSGAPSFATVIQPMLETNCAGCHADGQVGAHSWTLETAADAAEVSDGLAVVTGSGYMPPWPPSEEGVALQHPRGLDPSEIDQIAQWARAGGPLDVDPDTPVTAPDEPEVEQPRSDVVMALEAPYVGDGTTTDDYRCFLLDPGFEVPTAVTGQNFVADRTEVVHHALVYHHKARNRARIDEAAAADPRAGFDCTSAGGAMGVGATSGQLVAGWVPGKRPQVFSDETGFIFQPGDFLVAQIHYHYGGALLEDRSELHFQVDEDVDSILALSTRTLIGPVELPCPPGADGPLCDREAALVDAAERFGPGAGVIANGLHRICGTTPEGLAATSDGVTARTVCDYRLRERGEIVDVLGHMHELGAEYRMVLHPDTEREVTLLHIPVWNFAWQLNYQPVDPVPVAPGDTIRVECTWDRSLRFDPTPQYIFFAEGTEDEMCFSTVTVRPERPG